MATEKVTYQCAGCGAKKEVEVQTERQAKPPICCGQRMGEIARK